ncbi:STAS domain-containing protein [Streptomyces sp. R44]|uniref:STAS domain-containing protein n=1 Tax=Streptomyces sp. R44 TaxID=3238633 RepID=A0AB39SXY5_9ACTN
MVRDERPAAPRLHGLHARNYTICDSGFARPESRSRHRAVAGYCAGDKDLLQAGALPSPAPEPKIAKAVAGDAVVCVPAGDPYGDTAGAAARDLASTLERKPALLAVDLAAATLHTAEGLDVLPALRQDARARGVPPALLSPSRPVLRVLELTGADALFHAFGTVEEALAAYEP